MKKIMFNDRYGLTQAVLDGRKTMTRRLVSDRLWEEWTDYDDLCSSVGVGGLAEIGVAVTREYSDCKKFFLDNSPFKVGEIVAIAQAYNDFYNDECDPRMFPDGAGWTNKMFVRADLMPHQIRFNNHKVERLQDISDEDCIKEGIISWNCQGKQYFGFFDSVKEKFSRHSTPREAFASLIDKVSGKGTWESNPFTFAYEFERVKSSIIIPNRKPANIKKIWLHLTEMG